MVLLQFADLRIGDSQTTMSVCSYNTTYNATKKGSKKGTNGYRYVCVAKNNKDRIKIRQSTAIGTL